MDPPGKSIRGPNDRLVEDYINLCTMRHKRVWPGEAACAPIVPPRPPPSGRRRRTLPAAAMKGAPAAKMRGVVDVATARGVRFSMDRPCGMHEPDCTRGGSGCAGPDLRMPRLGSRVAGARSIAVSAGTPSLRMPRLGSRVAGAGRFLLPVAGMFYGGPGKPFLKNRMRGGGSLQRASALHAPRPGVRQGDARGPRRRHVYVPRLAGGRTPQGECGAGNGRATPRGKDGPVFGGGRRTWAKGAQPGQEVFHKVPRVGAGQLEPTREHRHNARDEHWDQSGKDHSQHAVLDLLPQGHLDEDMGRAVIRALPHAHRTPLAIRICHKAPHRADATAPGWACSVLVRRRRLGSTGAALDENLVDMCRSADALGYVIGGIRGRPGQLRAQPSGQRGRTRRIPVHVPCCRRCGTGSAAHPSCGLGVSRTAPRPMSIIALVVQHVYGPLARRLAPCVLRASGTRRRTAPCAQLRMARAGG